MSRAIFSQQRPWSRAAATELLDMSAGLAGFEDIGARQLDAAIALHRMLLTHGTAYLADEVGMGKTYVALATVALFRHIQPGFRVLYLAPSQNVLHKWHRRELPAFLANNVRRGEAQASNDVPPVASESCMRVDDWLRVAVSTPAVRDVFVPLSALSFQLSGDSDDWYTRVKGLAESAGVSVDLTGVKTKATFKERAAGIINDAIPYYDLVVIDEAHLLKGGSGTAASDRARFLARALGSLGHGGTRRFRAALLLSGTPFDRDLLQLARQFELFARPGGRDAPHKAITALAVRKRAGESWSEIQAGLKPYLIRRVQKLKVGGNHLSRNQYRVERRAEAGISLANDTSAKALRQRIFTAVVQKRLIEHLDGENEGRFPLAMYSSWEAYPEPGKRSGRDVPSERPPGTEADIPEAGTPQSDALDVEHDDSVAGDGLALDGAVMSNVVGSYREVFGKQPPHPKLEAETRRLAGEAFGQGLKQLVFVRRLKSVDDLFLRMNEAYDAWLVAYLQAEHMIVAPDEMLDARRAAASERHRKASAGKSYPQQTGSNEQLDDLPALGDTLFSWFFRGTLDGHGRAFCRDQTPPLPEPGQLRERLRDPERMESIIGELDWRSFVTERCAGLPEIPVREIAERASRLNGPNNVLMRYRRLQLAWVQLQAERLPAGEARVFQLLGRHLLPQVYGAGTLNFDRIEENTAKTLLAASTIPLALYQRGLGDLFLPAWDTAWQTAVLAQRSAGANLGGARSPDPVRVLESLDLQREVFFALLRLDHPFIDLYLGWRGASQDEGKKAAPLLVERLVEVCERDRGGARFGTASILLQLADAWEQIAKTNFADLLKGGDRSERSQWRLRIQQRLTPFAPVEWASGANTEGRSAIARRFRMPGYPMVLVSTSVLQEGEDLHVCCDRVTHFGISGSPIGIEQKNGRVDRIGARAQRRLLAGHPVSNAGIHVSFPHLSESLEWYQIRDLSVSINDYLRSIHKIRAHAVQGDLSLAATVANRVPIPSLLSNHLDSPFEPEWSEAEGDVVPQDVLRDIAG
ncbi:MULTISPECIES: helicase-related protein [unclassified Paraburkholderia]|uniref:helicase-related protein n=1 Tax=unclassified Paraburkholderia TaxID=2615204 RepID=UPI002AB1320E|nr:MULTISPECIES: helicase-related protein [unclassified Paraburkholderia]